MPGGQRHRKSAVPCRQREVLVSEIRGVEEPEKETGRRKVSLVLTFRSLPVLNIAVLLALWG